MARSNFHQLWDAAKKDMKIHPNVTQIHCHANELPIELYFIKGQRNAIIDTGIAQSPDDEIVPVLKVLGLTLADIDVILNTHGHFDHTGGNRAIKAVSNAQIFIHKDDAIFVEDPECCFNQYYASAIEVIRGRKYLEEEKVNFIKRSGRPVFVDWKLQDNDLIDLGGGVKLRTIHLPGHTQGSVGFYWEEEGILFSGDSVLGLFSSGGKLPSICNLPRYYQALERLYEMPINILLCTHHHRGFSLPPCPIKQGKEVMEFLRDSQEVAKQLVKVIGHIAPQASGRPFMEVANQVIAKLPKEMGFTSPMELQSLYSAITIFANLSCASINTR